MLALSVEIQKSTISPKLLFRTSLTCSVLLTLTFIGLVFHQTIWSALLLVELILIVGCGELLARNLPQRIRRQIELNQRRSNGSKSSRRAELEKHSVRRFKLSAMVCLGFVFVPINACVLLYVFYYPQIVRLSEEIHNSNPWIGILLEPVFQIAILLTVFFAIAYKASKRIYFRLLKDLDSEICRRAENYAAYDLINPPGSKAKQRSRAK